MSCNIIYDRVCGECEKGFYVVNGIECKFCFVCCNDDKDVRVIGCVE